MSGRLSPVELGFVQGNAVAAPLPAATAAAFGLWPVFVLFVVVAVFAACMWRADVQRRTESEARS